MRILETSRGEYRKKIGQDKTCPFCDAEIIADQEAPSLETEYWRVLACKHPYLEGNLMLIPKRHFEDDGEATEEEWKDLFVCLHKSKKKLGELFETQSFNLGLNIGPESGRSIPHIHYMLVPRVSRLRNYPVFEALNDLVVVTMDYKTLLKKIADSE